MPSIFWWFFDALRVKIRDEGLVRNKAVHITLGVRADGTKEILGLWIEQNECARFWLRVMNELKNRGVEDILLDVLDGLEGFPEAITAVFPEAMVQSCIVICCDTASTSSPTRIASRSLRRSRASTGLLTPPPLKRPWALLKTASGGKKYPATSQNWRRAWNEVVPFYARPTCVESCTRPMP